MVQFFSLFFFSLWLLSSHPPPEFFLRLLKGRFSSFLNFRVSEIQKKKSIGILRKARVELNSRVPLTLYQRALLERKQKRQRTKGRARSAARASNNDDDDGFLFCVFDSSEGVRWWWWWWCVVFFKVTMREDDWWAFGEEKTTTASSEERRRGREILRARRREDGGEIFISRCIYSFRRRRQMRENHPSE